MDLLRAAFLLESQFESQLPALPGLPVWKRQELERIASASIRAMREAADRIEQLEREKSAADQAAAAAAPSQQVRIVSQLPR